MHSPIYVFTLETNYIPDEETITDLAYCHYDADYVNHLPDETIDYKNHLPESMRSFFPHVQINNTQYTISIEDAKNYIEEIINIIKKHNETLSTETFRAWKNDLKYQLLESTPAFILDGSFYFLPEFTSILYNTMKYKKTPNLTITLQDVYDMHC